MLYNRYKCYITVICPSLFAPGSMEWRHIIKYDYNASEADKQDQAIQQQQLLQQSPQQK